MDCKLHMEPDSSTTSTISDKELSIGWGSVGVGVLGRQVGKAPLHHHHIPLPHSPHPPVVSYKKTARKTVFSAQEFRHLPRPCTAMDDAPFT